MMKPLLILTTIMLISTFLNTSGQNNQTDYLIVEKNYPGSASFEKSVKGSENIYFNKTEKSVLYQLDSLLSGKNVNNLHLYISVKAGEMDFLKIIINPENIFDYSDQLKGLKQLISGRVIVHNNLVFSEENGKLLKLKLQEISGLPFETR